MVLTKVPAIRYHDGIFSRIEEEVIREGRCTVFLNGERLFDQIVTLDNLAELGAGYIITEGIAEKVESVSVEETCVYVEADAHIPAFFETRSCGGIGTMQPPRKVGGGMEITPETVETIIGAIQTEEWNRTGGLHASVLLPKNAPLVRFYDIGRHNSVDKVVGYTELNGVDRNQTVLGCTGRQPAGMILKAANAGIPIIVSRAATTDGGVEAAKNANITLIGFARPGRFTLYSHPWRMSGANTSLK